MRVVLSALLLVLLDVAALPAAAQASISFKSSEWRTVLKSARIVLWGKKRSKTKARAQWDKRGYWDRIPTKKQMAALRKLLAKGNPYLVEKGGGRKTLPIETIDGGKTNVLFKLPAGYKPGRGAVGLLITVHGGPQSVMAKAETVAAQQYSYFTRAADANKLALASPPILSWRADPAGAKVILGIIDAVGKRWALDRSRIYLCGHSAGGVTSFMVGCPYADRFAGIAPFVCGIHHGRRLDNAYNLPCYHVLGKRDNPFFLKTGRQNSEYLKKLGNPLQIVEKDGGHDVFPSECAKSIAWLAKQPRKFWVKEVKWSPDSYRRLPGFYWVEGSTASGFSAKVEGQSITVSGSGPTALYLADELVDLDQPLTVSRDGRQLHSGKVHRSLKVALDWIEKTGDTSVMPTAKLALK